MPTRQVESTHDSPPQPQAASAEFRQSSQDVPRAEAKAEQDHPVENQNAGVESPSANSPTEPQAAREQPRRRPTGVEGPEADQMQGASGLPPETNADDATSGDQDIDTAGTAHDDLSPTKSM